MFSGFYDVCGINKDFTTCNLLPFHFSNMSKNNQISYL